MKVGAKPVTKTFSLKADPTGKAWVSFRQATFTEDMERADTYTKTRRYWGANENAVVIEENNNTARYALADIKTTLSGAGGFEDENDNPVELFKFKDHRNGMKKLDMSDQQLLEAIEQFGVDGSEIILEMRDYVFEMNPTWGTPRKTEEQKHDEPPKTPEEKLSTTSETSR